MINEIEFKLLDLSNKDIRDYYSKKLIAYEDIFNYPLGEKQFFIKHGYSGEHDYFDFFQQLGNVHYIVAEHNGILVAAGCAILRTIKKQKVWYLCDFKLAKEYRGKGILEKMFRKYVLKFYLKSNKMFFVNMSPSNGNGLIKKASNIFKLFNINTTDLYFFEWDINSINNSGLDFDEFVILTNKTKKDIVIDDMPYNIYHVVHKESYIDFSKFQIVELDAVKDGDTIMYCSPKNETVNNLLINNTPTTIGSFVSHKFNTNIYSSAEI